MNIHQRLAKAMGSISYIQKEKKAGMRYSIVSHDAVTAKVRPALLEAGIVYYPVGMTTAQVGNRTEAYVTVRFVNIDEPEDMFQVESFGYGIDDQDKGPGKAMSYAVKYALLKTLGLETGDDPDLDQDVSFSGKAEPGKTKSSYALKKDNPGRWNEVERMIRSCENLDLLRDLKTMLRDEAVTWPPAWKEAFNEEYESRRLALNGDA